MPRKDARVIAEFEIIDLSEVPGMASAPITDGEGSDVDRVLRALLHKKGNAGAASMNRIPPCARISDRFSIEPHFHGALR